MTATAKSTEQSASAVSNTVQLSCFSYRYVDAGNYKKWGSLFLSGHLTPDEVEKLRVRLYDSEFFIAEQVGVAPLQTDCDPGLDHCWHTFVDVVPVAEVRSGEVVWGTANDILRRFESVEEWDILLSPYSGANSVGCYLLPFRTLQSPQSA